jgi:hypothetical protein
VTKSTCGDSPCQEKEKCTFSIQEFKKGIWDYMQKVLLIDKVLKS